MSPVTLSRLLTIAALGVSLAVAQDPPAPTPFVPLYQKRYPSPAQLPYRVDTDSLVRGSQTGYNICNSTTENQQSLCQTAYFNDASDFCLWAPREPGEEVGNVEGEMVAWCTKPGHGTRLIPSGAITGLQYVKTPDYIQVVGFIDQRLINLKVDDYGGEMDPHGADLRGNPMGGVLFSHAFNGTVASPAQVPDWHNFMGGNAFCFRACDPRGDNAPRYCEHIFDRIGCAYNDPNTAKNGTFEGCTSDSADFPGVYRVNGLPVTYAQPPESLGPISTISYTPRTPTPTCTPLVSSVIFSGLPTPTVVRSSSSGLASSVRRTGSSTGAGPTPTAGTSTSDGTMLAVSGMSMLAVLFSALFLA